MHSRKYIHGDLKTANVMLDKNFNVYIIDMGNSLKMKNALLSIEVDS